MQEVLLLATIIAPVVLGLVEVLKRTTSIPHTLIPLTAVGVGFFAEPFTELDAISRLWAGGLSGLSATGLFELVRKAR